MGELAPSEDRPWVTTIDAWRVIWYAETRAEALEVAEEMLAALPDDEPWRIVDLTEEE